MNATTETILNWFIINNGTMTTKRLIALVPHREPQTVYSKLSQFVQRKWLERTGRGEYRLTTMGRIQVTGSVLEPEWDAFDPETLAIMSPIW